MPCHCPAGQGQLLARVIETRAQEGGKVMGWGRVEVGTPDLIEYGPDLTALHPPGRERAEAGQSCSETRHARDQKQKAAGCSLKATVLVGSPPANEVMSEKRFRDETSQILVSDVTVTTACWGGQGCGERDTGIKLSGQHSLDGASSHFYSEPGNQVFWIRHVWPHPSRRKGGPALQL